MGDEQATVAGGSEEWRDFEARHPTFRGALARLKDMLEAAFLRTVQGDDAATLAIFGRGRLAVADFFEIVFNAVNGYGFAALKLLRPLYERVVTGLYLLDHRGEAQDFIDFAHVNQRKMLNHAKSSGVDLARFVTDEQLAEIEIEYQRVKDRFRRDYWTTKDLKTLADEVGAGHMYATSAFWPTLLLHTSAGRARCSA